MRRWAYKLTIEEKKLALIKYADENQFKMSIRGASRYFGLSEKTVKEISDLLLLELIGRKNKNERLVIKKMLEETPHLTAPEAKKKTGSSYNKVYSVARQIGYRFDTRYTRSAELKRQLILHNKNSILCQ